jgi:hypothetical protein
MSSRSLRYHHQSSHAVPASDGRSHPGVRGFGVSAYTLTHRGRQLRIGPLAFWLVLGTLAVMAAWTITTASYFAFREDVLTRLIARQAEMQFGYEDRIAELRAQVDPGNCSTRSSTSKSSIKFSAGRRRWNREPTRWAAWAT